MEEMRIMKKGMNEYLYLKAYELLLFHLSSCFPGDTVQN